MTNWLDITILMLAMIGTFILTLWLTCPRSEKDEEDSTPIKE